MPRSFNPSRMAAAQSTAFSIMAAEDSPSPMTICTAWFLGSDSRSFRAFSSSKQRPKSGRVRYSSLLLHFVCTSVMPWFFAKSSGTWVKTVSCAAAWSARKRSMVRVLYRAPALPLPRRAGVFSFRRRNSASFWGASTRYSLRKSSCVTSGTKSPGLYSGAFCSG